MARHGSRGSSQPGAGRDEDSEPGIAWTAAARLRNRIVHGYWDIDVETLVATATDDLPQMIADLDRAIDALS